MDKKVRRIVYSGNEINIFKYLKFLLGVSPRKSYETEKNNLFKLELIQNLDQIMKPGKYSGGPLSTLALPNPPTAPHSPVLP